MKYFVSFLIVVLFFVAYYLILRSVATSAKRQRIFKQQVLDDLDYIKNKLK